MLLSWWISFNIIPEMKFSAGSLSLLFCSISVFTMTVNSCQAKSAVNYWWFQVESILVLCCFLSGWTRNMLCELSVRTVGWQLTCWKKKVRLVCLYIHSLTFVWNLLISDTLYYRYRYNDRLLKKYCIVYKAKWRFFSQSFSCLLYIASIMAIDCHCGIVCTSIYIQNKSEKLYRKS